MEIGAVSLLLLLPRRTRTERAAEWKEEEEGRRREREGGRVWGWRREKRLDWSVWVTEWGLGRHCDGK